ncbi:thermonuclease family protein [Mesomycoplasma flocculare]|uniref:thermonuclease family protein n=1 Tax=Mesomycoplasma flocculare TaxID=2128 RepID=UPI002FE33075
MKDVYDGDTFTDKNNRHFRLFGIDTPELQLHRPNPKINPKLMKFHGLRAKKILQDFIWNRWISFEIVNIDNYNRIVVIIENESGENLNLKMVERGFAINRYSQYENPKKNYYYPEHKNLIDRLRNAQEKAKKANLLLWNDGILPIYGINSYTK